MEDVVEIIQIVNKIKDNLWLGDIREAHNLIHVILTEKFVNERVKYYHAAEAFRDLYKNIRSRLREEYKGINLSFNLSTEFNRKIQKLQINPSEAVLGSILDYIERLYEKLKNVKEFSEVSYQNSYKYILRNFGYKYEVRILLLELKEIDIRKLNDAIIKMGFQPSIIAKTKSYVMLTAFSNDAYIEMTVFNQRVHIVLRVSPTASMDIEKMIENIMSSISRWSFREV